MSVLPDSDSSSDSASEDESTASRIERLVVDGVELVVISAGCVAVPDELTDAEREVARLVVEGRSNREIAETRGSSERTVANQLGAIYRKLGVTSRYELVARLDHDLVPKV